MFAIFFIIFTLISFTFFAYAALGGDQNHFPTHSSIPDSEGTLHKKKLFNFVFLLLFGFVQNKVVGLNIIPVHIIRAYGEWRHSSTNFTSQP